MAKKAGKIYVVGHKNPDTDSICSAIAYANLKREITGNDYIAKRAGQINEETHYVLQKFGVKVPTLLENVKLQVKDMDIHQIDGIGPNVSMKDTWIKMKENNIKTIPILRDEELLGVISTGDIATSYMEVYDNMILSKAKTQYRNIMNTLDGEMVTGNEHGYFTKGKAAIGASSPELMQQYLGNTMQLSASSLERYQKCPFRYYCNDILRLYQRQKVQMNAANYGSMVHYCLEQLLRKYDKKSFLALTAEQLQQEIQTSAAVYWQENMGGDFSKSEREQAAYHHAVEEVLPVCQHLQEEFRQSAFVPYCTELQISSENPNFPPICLHTEAGQTVKLIGKIDRVDICQDGDQQWVRVVDYKTNGKIFELGNLLYGLDMQMLIYLFSILSEGTALAGSKPAGVLYLPAGKVKCNLKREDAVSPAAKRNQSYQMNGVLLQDAHLLRLMEKNGDGVYLNGKLNATGGLELNKGIFLTTGQMKGLRQYVLNQLIYMAERVYRGEIDALPLDMGSKTVCEYCDFSNVCGTSSLCRKRLRLGSATVQKSEMMRILEELAEEEKH